MDENQLLAKQKKQGEWQEMKENKSHNKTNILHQ